MRGKVLICLNMVNCYVSYYFSVKCCSHQVVCHPRRAFSLMEMLVVIALIGLLSTISLALMTGDHRETVQEIRDQRNAQEIVNLATAAQAAGAPVIENDDMRGTIQNLIDGTSPKSGSFRGRTFRLNNLREEEINGALQYLEWEGGQPIYIPRSD